MNCARFAQVLDAWLDGELDAGTNVEISQHVESCRACSVLAGGRGTLRQSIRDALPYQRAPAALQRRVRAAIASSPSDRPRRGLSWLQAGAFAACAALLSALLTFWVTLPRLDDTAIEQVVTRHVAALSDPTRLVDIRSDERHKVKPWFQGKTDFAPTVKDLSQHGFVLLGARIDHVGERQAAALVYRIREHLINVFVWRADDQSSPLRETRSRGFSVGTWVEGGLRYSVVSDVDPRDVRRLTELLRER